MCSICLAAAADSNDNRVATDAIATPHTAVEEGAGLAEAEGGTSGRAYADDAEAEAEVTATEEAVVVAEEEEEVEEAEAAPYGEVMVPEAADELPVATPRPHAEATMVGEEASLGLEASEGSMLQRAALELLSADEVTEEEVTEEEVTAKAVEVVAEAALEGEELPPPQVAMEVVEADVPAGDFAQASMLTAEVVEEADATPVARVWSMKAMESRRCGRRHHQRTTRPAGWSRLLAYMHGKSGGRRPELGLATAQPVGGGEGGSRAALVRGRRERAAERAAERRRWRGGVRAAEGWRRGRRGRR